MTIGELAKAAAVSIETIRYYQRIGLILVPVKTPGSIRRYSEKDRNRLHFIVHAKKLGFTLKDIATLLSLESADCAEAKSVAQHKLVEIQSNISDLQAIAMVLEELLVQCNLNVNSPCPIIDTLKPRSS